MNAITPIIGSAIVSIATLFVLHKTLQHNRQALHHSYTREVEQMHRAATVESSASAVMAAASISSRLMLSTTEQNFLSSAATLLNDKTDVIKIEAARLRIVSTPDMARQCDNLSLTCQKAIAHTLLDWHEAKKTPTKMTVGPSEESTSFEINDAQKRIYAQATMINDAAKEFAKAAAVAVGNPNIVK